jgi:hypothetical protein
MSRCPNRLFAALVLVSALASTSTEAKGGSPGLACPDVAISNYGFGCATQFDVPELAVGHDPSACTLTFKLSGFQGCCNTYLWNRIFIFGTSPVSVPVPPFAAGCVLLASPDLILVLPNSFGNSFTVQLPAILDVTVYAQGVNDYFTTLGLSHDYNWSQGVKIDIG